MYGQFFNLDESAFSIAPNPKYLYLSGQHEEALAHLLYGVTRPGGFVLITGEIGTGKTTVCRSLFLEIPENTEIALIVNPNLNPDDLLASICDELEITYPEYKRSSKTYINKLNERLIQSHAEGRNTILIIDEAQNLSVESLEAIRALTNLETDEQKLLQIILMGQPELRDRLNSPELEQLNQRITARFHLKALSRSEVKEYIDHRLKIGNCNDEIFSHSNIDLIYKLTNGVPRLINVLCDRSLLGAFVQKKKIISNDIIRKSAAEALGKPVKEQSSNNTNLALAAAFALIAITFFVFFYDTEKNNVFNDGKDIAEDISTESIQPQIENEPLSVSEATTGQGEQEILESVESAHEEVQKNPSLTAKVAALDNDFSNKPAEEKLSSDSKREDQGEVVDLSPKQWAYKALFESWGLEYSDFSIEPCEFAQQQGLFCFPGVGDASLLQRLNRPVLLKKNTSKQEDAYLLVKYIDRDEVIVVEQSGEYRVSWEQISQSWRGRYDLLWKPVTGIKFIRPGMQGEFVKKIDENLSVVFNRPPRWDDYDAYDQSLVKEVVSFQRAQKIPSDGVIGPLTQIYMNNLVREDGPRLR